MMIWRPCFTSTRTYLAPVIDIGELLSQLARQRPIFHSEADFQHALAWELHRRLPDARVRLEMPMEQLDGQRYLDIYLRQGDRILAIELKYKTQRLSVTSRGERFDLKNQSAQNFGRRDFVKDVWRLEQFVDERQGGTGCAILLTNDSRYWKRPDRLTMDHEFRLHAGPLSGSLRWRGVSADIKKKGDDAIELRSSYRLQWSDFSQPSTASYGRFRFLIVKVTASNGH